MPYNWQITVASPILLAGMSFKVRYRKLPSTTWLDFLPNPTTNTFTIPNLSDGTWEVEIITVCANGGQSPPRYHIKTFGNECCAPTITSATAATGGGGGGTGRTLRFNNNTSDDGVLRVWINNPLGGAPDIEISGGQTQSVTVTGAFSFHWAFIITGSMPLGTAKLTKYNGFGGQSLNFTTGYTNTGNPEPTACQAENVQMECSGNTLPTGDPTTDFSLEVCTSQISFINNSDFGIIDGVSPAFFLMDIGTFPVGVHQIATGVHGGYSGNITVSLSNTTAAHTLRLIVAGVIIEEKSVTAAGNYTFTGVSIVSGDLVTITLEDNL